MTYCYIDFETRSPVPIRSGTDRYMTQAEPTLVTWAVDNEEVQCYEFTGNETPPALRQVVEQGHTFVAHNAPFDRAVTQRCLGWNLPTSRWLCTRAQAYSVGLPGGLDGIGAALGIPGDVSKLADGKRLIQLFCVPKKDGTYNEPWEYPNEWEQFKQYAIRDTEALRAVHKRLPTANFNGANLRYFWLDAEINERGFAIDLPLVDAAIDLLDRAKSRGDSKVTEITGGAVTAVTQREKLLSYLQRQGLQLPNLRKSELEAALQSGDLSPEQRLLVESRLEGARASGAKYRRARETHVDGRLRYTQQFSGAGRTGRTAHKGFQPGNMPRAVSYNGLARTLAEQHVPVKAKFIDEVILPAIRDGSALDNELIHGGPNTVAANALRHTIRAAPGCELTVADYKNIESRVLAWLAFEDWKLAAYAAADLNPEDKSLDQYRLLYARFFGVDIKNLTDHERQAGKVIELACGFGGSVGAFVTMAVGYGMDLSTLPSLVLARADGKLIAKAEKAWWRAFLSHADYDLEPDVFIACHVLVQSYRAANPRIDSLKRSLGKAVEAAVRTRGTLFEVGRCKIFADANVLIVELPSGYRLCYWAPLIETEKVVDPEDGEEEERTFLSFKRARGSKMIRERSWPGLTLENIVQATANQVLRYGKLEVENVYPGTLVLAVHDEAVAEAPRGAIDLGVYERTLCKGWNWCRGLPLAADGWQHGVYGKR